MEPHLIWYLVIIIACVIMSAYFSATETAFSTFNRIRMKNLAEKGDKKAEKAIKLADDFDTLISTILIGNNIVNILATALATLFFTELIVNADVAATVSTAVLTVIILLFGEISPKTMAKNSPEKFARFSAPIISAFQTLFTPLTFLLKKLQNLLAKLAKNEEDKGMTEEELISIIEEAEEEGDIDKEESDLIKSAIEFGDLEVGDIFTPRIDVTAISKDADKESIATAFTESGYSRLPVYEGDIDNVIGILYYKDFYATAYNTEVPIDEIIKPAIYVAVSQPVNELMKELQEKQLHMAIVTDEFGSTAGLITLEDILEEIVGEIWDEHDEIVEEIKEVADREFLVSGKSNIDKFFSHIDLDEESDNTTVGGWVMEALGKIPEVGDSFEAFDLCVEVVEMDGRRVESVRIVDNRVDESVEKSSYEDAEEAQESDEAHAE